MLSDSDKAISTISQDLLGLDSYCKGAAQYIQRCKTPITISIQGEWGSGKTSMMQMIKSMLSGTCRSISIETWQYSYASDSQTLPLVILTDLAESISSQIPHSESASAAKNVILSALRSLSLKVSTDGIAKLLGLKFELAVDGSRLTEMHMDSATSSTVKNVRELISGFSSLVKEATRNGRRLVIFIDDLDRLAPARAVDVLECLKVFVDTPDCVFVIAIDFEVVRLGIQDRYESYEAFDSTKAAAFFEKIIQVPLRLPVEHYTSERIVAAELAANSFPFDEKVASKFSDIAIRCVGKNPRSLKRLISTYGLLDSIHSLNQSARTEMKHPNRDSLLLFAILGLQIAFPDVYRKVSVAHGPLFSDESEVDGEHTENGPEYYTDNDSAIHVLQLIRDTKISSQEFGSLLKLSALSVSVTNEKGLSSTETIIEQVIQNHPDLENVMRSLLDGIWTSMEDVRIEPQSNPDLWSLVYEVDGAMRRPRRFGMITVNQSNLRIDLGTASLQSRRSSMELEELIKNDPTFYTSSPELIKMGNLRPSPGRSTLVQIREVNNPRQIDAVVRAIEITRDFFKSHLLAALA